MGCKVEQKRKFIAVNSVFIKNISKQYPKLKELEKRTN